MALGHCRVVPTISLVALALCPAMALAFPEQTPGLLHSMLLKGVIVNPVSGALRLDPLQAVYLPDPPQGSHSARADDPARQLWAVLTTADGTTVARFDFDSEKLEPPLWLLPYNKVTIPGQQGDALEPKLAPGDYVLDFFLASGKLYSFPFSVRLIGGKSLTMGDWNSWGYLMYARAEPEQPLVWKMWLRRHETGNRDGIDLRIQITRDEDKKLIATSRPDNKQWPNDFWVRYDFDLIHPMQGTSGGAFLKAADLLGQDGAYTLRITVDGAAYGVWTFRVARGKLVPAGRTDRETADPLRFVCGGQDAFWYGSEATAQVGPGTMAPVERTFAQKGFIPDCKAVVAGGTTLVMMAPVVTFLEAQSQWNAGAKILTITHGDRSISLTLGQPTGQSNAGPVALGAAPMQREGDFYAPLKAVAQALGAEVEWDAKMRLLMVIDGDRAGLIHVP